MRAAQETAIGQLVWSPGGHTGWHTHPGPAVVLVKSGQLSFYDGEDPTCTARIYSAGQSFIDSGQGHVHLVRNESQTENAEVWTTYFDVPPGGATRIDAPNPGNCIGF
ncbi:MAG: cupin domain-containing protein [Acidobacteriota bacterium]|nr:cupin domain-containing protein [Acidobacteriota bacterium]